MVLYGTSLSVLEDQVWREYNGYLQSWYDDEFSMEGAGDHLKTTISRIEAMGIAHGFFLKRNKSQFLRYPEVSEAAVRASTAPLEFINEKGTRKLGFFVGSDEAKHIWVEENM